METLEIAKTDWVVLTEPAHLKIQFERLRRLEAGWNDAAAPPLSRSMLESFATLLHEYEGAGIPRPSLYPTDDGEARAEWSCDPWEIALSASPTDSIFTVEALNRTTDEWIKDEFQVSRSDELLVFLHQLLRSPYADR